MPDYNQIEREQQALAYDGEDQVLPASEVLKRYIANKPKGERVMSKLSTLDNAIGGFYPGQLVTISGITGTGKTELCRTFTKNMSEQLTNPLWFSYEVATDDFIEAFHPDYRPHIYMPAKLKGNSVEWLEERIIESMVKYATNVVMIDHIHYLIKMTSRSNMSFVIGEAVQAIKQIAIKHNIIIFLVAHMMKTKSDEEPSLGHIRDSSFIEQESDTVLYVWRHAKDQSVTICKVAKNRKRGIVDVKIALTLQKGVYHEVEWRDER